MKGAISFVNMNLPIIELLKKMKNVRGSVVDERNVDESTISVISCRSDMSISDRID